MIFSVRWALVGLRDEQRELTRRKVLGAVVELVAEGTVEELSVPAVARRSGVSVATIYRHFPSRDDLLTQASLEGHRLAATSAAGEPTGTEDRFTQFVHQMWQQYAQNLPLLRHQIGSEVGRELRRARVGPARSYLTEHLDQVDIDCESPQGQRLISILMLITGSVAIIELHDRQGLDIDEAIHAALWAAEILTDATSTTHASTTTTPQ